MLSHFPHKCFLGFKKVAKTHIIFLILVEEDWSDDGLHPPDDEEEYGAFGWVTLQINEHSFEFSVHPSLYNSPFPLLNSHSRGAARA